MAEEAAVGTAPPARARTGIGRAGGWVALAGAVGTALAVFALPYAAIDEPTRRDWWGVAFFIHQGDPVINPTARWIWSPDVWAWAGVSGGILGAAALAALRGARTRRIGGFLAGAGVLVALRLWAEAAPAVRSDLTHAEPGLFVGLAGALLLVLGGLIALRAAPRHAGHRPAGSRTPVALAAAGAAAFAASTVLPASTFSGGPITDEPAFPFVRIGEGLSAWATWLWPAAFVTGVIVLSILGVAAARRAAGPSAGAGLALAGAWAALALAAEALSIGAPAAQARTGAAYLGLAGAVALLLAAGLVAGGGPPLPRRGSLSP